MQLFFHKNFQKIYNILIIKYLQTKKKYICAICLAFLSFPILFTKNANSSTSNFVPLAFNVFLSFFTPKQGKYQFTKTKKNTIFMIENPNKVILFIDTAAD